MPNIGIWGLSQTGSSVSSGTIFYYPFFPFFPFLKAPPLLLAYQGIVWAPDLPFRFTHVFIYPNVLFPSCTQSPTVITLPLFVPEKSSSAVQSSSHTISPWTFLLFLSSHQILPNTVLLMPQYPRLGAPPQACSCHWIPSTPREGMLFVIFSLQWWAQCWVQMRHVKVMLNDLNSYLFPPWKTLSQKKAMNLYT